MKAFALAVVTAVALASGPSATADNWFDEPAFRATSRYDGHHGGPYYVAGYGDDSLGRPRRYWGGPYWVSCRGYNPPFETYRMSCRASAVKIASRNHRHIRARLK